MEKSHINSQVQSARYYLFDIPIDSLSMEETMAKIEDFIKTRKLHLVVTADAAAIMMAEDHVEFKKILQNASLVTADGAGITWALRKKYGINLARVSGVDLVEKFCGKSAEKGYRIFFLGSSPGVAEQAAEKMIKRYPGCQIVGHQHGYFSADENQKIAEKIAETRPDLLFVALGMPRQEKFILETQTIHQVPVAIGVGGSLDVLSGNIRRAPKIVQKFSMEWLWRLINNPSKIQKVKQLPRFAYRVLRSGR